MQRANPPDYPTPLQQIQPALGYAGDILPPLAWAWLQSGQAVLVEFGRTRVLCAASFTEGVPALKW